MSHRLSTSLPGFHNDLRIGQCAVFTSEESAHVGEGVTEIQFIALTFHIAKVGGTQHARVTQQGMVDIYQRLLLEDVQRREARPPLFRASSSAPGAISSARLVLTSRALGFISARSAAVTR